MVEGVRASGVGGSVPVARDGTKTGDTPFLVNDGAAPLNQKARASSVAGIGLESMLALQAVDERSERDRDARKRGTALLASLTKLQRVMLAGMDPGQTLQELNELATGDPGADDPGLAAILRAIVLRSRVEIALRERRDQGRGGGPPQT